MYVRLLYSLQQVMESLKEEEKPKLDQLTDPSVSDANIFRSEIYQ